MSKAKAENLVIMFTDIVGFTELTSTQSRDQNEAMLRQNEKLLHGVAKRFGGKRIKSIGDSLLIVFKSPTDAVHCAMAMHDSLWEYNQTVESEPERLTIRISLNSGEVRIDGGDVFGEPVNVAARLEGMTPANEVYFTEAIYLSMNKAEVSNELVGRYKLKGIPEEVTVYRVPRGASAQRLVAVGNETDIDHQYPYGGMHKMDTGNTGQGISFGEELPFAKIAMAAMAVVAIGAAVMFWPMSTPVAIPDQSAGAPTSTQITQDAAAPEVATSTTSVAREVIPAPVVELDQEELDLLFDTKNLIALEAKLGDILLSNPAQPEALFMKGHLAMERREFKDGLEEYAMAITANPDLAHSERYANNLIRAMPGRSAKVTELAKMSPTDEVVNRLSRRSVSSGLNGRRNAAQLLRELERQDKMDAVAMALLDLKEVSECEDKKKAIGILEKWKDSRALPALNEIVAKKKGLGFLKRTCGARAARRAINAIEDA